MRRERNLQKSLKILFLVFFGLIFGLTFLEASEADQAKIEESFGRLPLYFVENRGQLHEDVFFYLQGSDKILYFTSQGVTFVLAGKENDEDKRWIVKLSFVGANPKARPMGRQSLLLSHVSKSLEGFSGGPLPTAQPAGSGRGLYRREGNQDPKGLG